MSKLNFANVIDTAVNTAIVEKRELSTIVDELKEAAKVCDFKVPISTGYIKAHIRYRIKKNPAFFGKKEGILLGTKKTAK